jgi:hypothetical protein
MTQGANAGASMMLVRSVGRGHACKTFWYDWRMGLNVWE